ncbi:hypothetical protein [Leptospira weilii]|uniref:hypothetical protein n=1 Tax=Leptospira weilii TaxID=28184 RepID=UPI0002BE7D35|nr:hypothetical protein [Leptospira weilii]EMJ65334.1 hypothetical protein LEP1GSC051_4096 [Leptospira sp. P2653]MCL8266855.1 hypothetical protein [Leptospira weilii]MDL5244418.1 hypothetical protein [Leptospira weilii]QDK24147.1 hypothetical protein FHG67_16545 [Leptospira weilii]QDK28109.1 hypothetical protein FHG68_16595 [Leptospira weilii]
MEAPSLNSSLIFRSFEISSTEIDKILKKKETAILQRTYYERVYNSIFPIPPNGKVRRALA